MDSVSISLAIFRPNAAMTLATIATRLRAIQSAGVDELMITIHPAAAPAAEEAAAIELLGALRF